jgi:hypothetical protein
MAQHKLVKAANGTGLDGVVASSNATNITTDELWVIVSATATRESAIANLRDVLNYMQASKNPFPFA